MTAKSFLKAGMAIATCLLIVVAALTTLSVQAAPGDLSQRVYMDQASYNPSDTVTIAVEIKNNTGADWSGTLYLDVRYLETPVHSDSQSLSIAAGATATKTFTWATPSTDFQGDQVEVQAGATDANVTAIDLSSDWTRRSRCGFVYASTPGQTQAQSQEEVRLLAENHHINVVQFYDWMWRHQQVMSRTNGIINDPWDDWAGNPISLAVIQDLVTAARNYEMAATPYFTVYGALRDDQQISRVNPQWGLYFDASRTNQVLFGDDNRNANLWIFNPSNTDWQNHIFRPYDDAILTPDFDGIHPDRMGNYSNTTYYDYWGNVVDLGNHFSAFINNKEHVSALAHHTPGKAGKDILYSNANIVAGLRIDKAKGHLDYAIAYLGDLGLGAEQVDENKRSSLWRRPGPTSGSPTALSVEVYAQTDAQPTSASGTSLSWSYNASMGRVKSVAAPARVSPSTSERDGFDRSNGGWADLIPPFVLHVSGGIDIR